MKRCFKTIFAIAIIASLLWNIGGKSVASATDKNMTVNKITGVDGLGRELSDVAGYKQDKYVGLFYFLWLGQQNQKKLYDITDILRTHTIDELINVNSSKFPNDDVYFFNEPLFGYYNSGDPWLLESI